MNHEQLYDRILGCLVTAGMGDAIGAPSEAMSRAEILEKFGGPIDTFLDGGENAYAYGNLVGEVTDDASQMYEMAKAVIACGGKLTVEAAAQALVTWSESYPKYYPRTAGPTTSYVINELKAGKDPIATGLVGHVYGRGTSNGAAMRVAAAGLCRPGDLDYAVRTAVTMTAPSHGTQHAYAGACWIAAGIAAAIGGAGLYGVLKACLYGAEEGERIGRAEARTASGPRLQPKLLQAVECALSSRSVEEAGQKIEALIGNDGSIQPSVAAAVGLFAAAEGDPARTILGGANIGGDTDTIACIAGMLAGAYAGFSALPQGWYATFRSANPTLDFESAAERLTVIAQNA